MKIIVKTSAVLAILICSSQGETIRGAIQANKEPTNEGLLVEMLEEHSMVIEDNTTSILDNQDKEVDLLPDSFNNSDRMHRQAWTCPSYAGYVFWAGYDSTSGDLMYKNPSSNSQLDMIRYCDSTPGCKGFNTNGYMKGNIKPLRSWYSFTSNSCEGMYIKSATSFRINGNQMTAREIDYFKWIAAWTIPNFGMSPYTAIRDYIAKGTWWTLKEGTLDERNVFNYNNCNIAPKVDRIIGPLETCADRRAWQVGIAGVQVPNFSLSQVEQRATSVYGQDVVTVLGRSAQQAGYAPGTSTYNSIRASTGNLRKAWLLKSHLVGFFFVEEEVRTECLISRPKTTCYGTGWDTTRWYAPTASSIPGIIDEVMIILQSLSGGY
jgi:hypothetical protein